MIVNGLFFIAMLNYRRLFHGQLRNYPRFALIALQQADLDHLGIKFCLGDSTNQIHLLRI